MAELWKPNPVHWRLSLDWSYQWNDVQIHPERYSPYKRLYNNLNQAQLLELIKDAKQHHWKVLDLRLCGLDALPEELGELPDLQVLVFGNNIYSKEIHGSANNFSSLPVSIGDLANLQLLSLEYCSITTLPESIEHLSNLKLLYLNDSNIMSCRNLSVSFLAWRHWSYVTATSNLSLTT